MAMWGVCGSAVACGARWDTFSISTKKMPVDTFQTFDILHDCVVGYQSSCGPSVEVCNDGAKWHTSSGTGIITITFTEVKGGTEVDFGFNRDFSGWLTSYTALDIQNVLYDKTEADLNSFKAFVEG